MLTLEPKKTFTLVGIFGYSGGRDSLGGVPRGRVHQPVAQQLMLGETDVYTSIDVKAADGRRRTRRCATGVAAALGAGYEVKTGEQLAEDERRRASRRACSFFNNILLGFAGVALFVGIFLILNTFSIIVAQRTRELALMRAHRRQPPAGDRLGAARGRGRSA